jgi:hypothetical protein
MITAETFRQLALSLPDTVELPHFERTSFRINKKIFATLGIKENLACLMFDPIQQSVFCAYDKTIIYPVPNKWGSKGATYMDLKKVRKDVAKQALQVAYGLVSEKAKSKKKIVK